MRLTLVLVLFTSRATKVQVVYISVGVQVGLDRLQLFFQLASPWYLKLTVT